MDMDHWFFWYCIRRIAPVTISCYLRCTVYKTFSIVLRFYGELRELGSGTVTRYKLVPVVFCHVLFLFLGPFLIVVVCCLPLSLYLHLLCFWTVLFLLQDINVRF
jgi:hypothetical protein